jgi:hypothetical protein
MDGGSNGGQPSKAQVTHCHVPNAFMKDSLLVSCSLCQLSPNMPSPSVPRAKRTLSTLMKTDAKT